MAYLSLKHFLQVGRNKDSSKCAPGTPEPDNAPISRAIPELPVEILQDVFLKYCTIDIQQFAEDAKQYKRESHGFPPSHPNQLRCRLSLVCRRWETVLKTTPRIWSQLVILDHIPDNHTFEKWLKWSQPFPLELLIFLWRPQERVIVEELMSLLSTHVSRFRFFMAEFSRHNQYRNVLTTYLFPVEQVIYMPELRFIHLRQFFAPAIPPVMGSIVSPKLSKLSLLSGYQYGGSNFITEGLEYAHVVFTKDVAQDLKLLSRAKLLRKLNIGFDEAPITVPNTSISLEHLKTLKLAIHLPSNIFAWGNFLAVFEQLRFPALELLDISVSGHHSRRDVSPLIRNLVFGKSTCIRELSCVTVSLGPDFYDILAQFQKLKKLSLLSCTIEETFFRRFTESPASSPHLADGYLCPTLEEIQLTPCAKISVIHLEQLLRLREDVVVSITLQNFEMDINDSTAMVSLEETYPQFALRVSAINSWTMNAPVFPVKYLAKAFSMINLL